jgi:hypothetical protein
MTKTTTQLAQLRDAAEHLRTTIKEINTHTPESSPTQLSDALAELDRTGFSKTTTALAVARWLDVEAHSLQQFGMASAEALAVAELILPSESSRS